MTQHISQHQEDRSDRSQQNGAQHNVRAALVSVVIPMFNHERYIVQCLNSIASQRYNRIELLIIDDGSTDESFTAASKWLDRHCSRFERCEIRRQPNKGIPRTLNTLIEVSHGKYIYLIASDDMAAPDAISKLVALYEAKCKKPMLVITDVSLMDEQGRPLARSASEYRHRDPRALEASPKRLEREIVLKWGIPLSQQFYSREFYDAVGGYDEALDFEDMYFALRAVAIHAVLFTRIISKYYRVRDGNSPTPGLTLGVDREIKARALVLHRFPIAWRIIMRILNCRDSLAPGIRHELISIVVAGMRFVGRATS